MSICCWIKSTQNQPMNAGKLSIHVYVYTHEIKMSIKLHNLMSTLELIWNHVAIRISFGWSYEYKFITEDKSFIL